MKLYSLEFTSLEVTVRMLYFGKKVAKLSVSQSLSGCMLKPRYE